ncbi:MAG: hypothetical protein CVU11_07150 [Bacteroidetes bacterium HGW-Bacteroidetes-6]|jgi:hypothetical protein|nr:MAG: hypothetical protein CVU11_07150 [Bacteroidetes bacterium HGW-Bacteroidetes-6]
MKKILKTFSVLICVCNASFAQNLLWTRYVASENTEFVYSLEKDTYNNLFLAGSYYNFIDANPGSDTFLLNTNGSSDMMIIKMNSEGEFIWASSMGGVGDDAALSAVADNYNNVYATGAFQYICDFNPDSTENNITTHGGLDAFLLKLDNTGQFKWVIPIGGINDDYGTAIAADENGDVVLAGQFSDVVDFDPGVGSFELDATGALSGFFAKYDSTGHLIWANIIKSSNAGMVQPKSLTIDNNGDIYLCGSFTETADFDPGIGVVEVNASYGFKGFLAKYSSDGTLLWLYLIGNEYSSDMTSVILAQNNKLYLTGSFNGTGDFDMSSGTSERTSVGTDDAFLLKLDTSGSFNWVVAWGGSDYDIATDAIEENGYVMVGGNFIGMSDFDPTSGISNLISTGYGGFLSRFDTAGVWLGVKQIKSTSTCYPLYLVADNTENAIVAGTFAGNLELESGNIFTGQGSTDVFIVKVKPEIATVEDFESNNSLAVFPNPCSNEINLTSETGSGLSEYVIYNNMGQVVQNGTLPAAQVLSVKINLVPGLYLFELKNEFRSLGCARIIVE